MTRVFMYMIGTAGSGKSTLAGAVQQWMLEHAYSPFVINLDPGADSLPYEPDLDIRDEVSLADVMAEMELGPNGAQVACADILALRAPAISQEISEVDADLVLLDTPGQIELFAFRHSSRRMVEELGSKQTMLLFLFDPFLSQTPNGFVSQQMLAATVEFRFGLPFLPVLSKTDMLDGAVKEQVLKWSEDPRDLYDAVAAEIPTMDRQLNEGMFRAIEDLGAYRSLIPASSETGEGLEDIYTQVQRIFFAGEDLEAR